MELDVDDEELDEETYSQAPHVQGFFSRLSNYTVVRGRGGQR